MKIQILSDLHLEFGYDRGVFSSEHIVGDVVILAGDTHVSPDLLKEFLLTINKVPIVLVLGNHEFYGRDFYAVKKRYQDLLCSPSENLYLLENQSLELPQFQGYTFLGATLWTSFEDAVVELSTIQKSVNDYKMITDRGVPITPSVTQREHRESVRFLAGALFKSKNKVVVVSHHAPSYKSIHPKFVGNVLNPSFVSNLDYLIEAHQPCLWVHGHSHASASYNIGETQVICNPFGYREFEENLAFKPRLFVEI